MDEVAMRLFPWETEENKNIYIYLPKKYPTFAIIVASDRNIYLDILEVHPLFKAYE